MFSRVFLSICTLLCLTGVIFLEVQGTLPSPVATIRRIRPIIRLPESYKSNVAESTHSRSGSVSSFSSSHSEDSISRYQTGESEAIQSTSTGKRAGKSEFKEVELRPMINSPKHVSFMKAVDFSDASTSTHTHGNINPARDGARARMRNAVLRFGAAAVVGTAVGAGAAVAINQNLSGVAVAIHQNFSLKSTNESVMETTTLPITIASNEELNNFI